MTVPAPIWFAVISFITFALVTIHQQLVTDLKKNPRTSKLTRWLISHRPLGCTLCMTWWYSLATSLLVVGIYIVDKTMTYPGTLGATLVLAGTATGAVLAFRRAFPGVSWGPVTDREPGDPGPDDPPPI